MADNNENNDNTEQEEESTTWGGWFKDNWWWVLPLLVVLLAAITAGIVWYMRSSSIDLPEVDSAQMTASQMTAPQPSMPSVPVAAPQMTAPQVAQPSMPSVPVTAPQMTAPQVGAKPRIGTRDLYVPQFTPTNYNNVLQTPAGDASYIRHKDFDQLLNTPGAKTWMQNGYDVVQLPDNQLFATQYPPPL